MNRLEKTLATLIIAPFLCALMIMLAGLMLVLPLAVFINPDILTYKE